MLEVSSTQLCSNFPKLFAAFLVLLAITVKDVAYCWPEGTYGLPMTDSGCPEGSGDFSWLHGSRTQTTKSGSFASEGTHLAGFYTNEKTDHITQNFCMKTISVAYGDHTWSKGNYCIFKRNKCPSGMRSGHVIWEDDVSVIDWSLGNNLQYQTTSGELPNGVYDHDTTIEYCCRTDGYASVPISLPTEYPFYLLRLGAMCQKVKDMNVKEEFVQWAGDMGMDRNKDPHPTVSHTPSYMKLYYCYYTPVEQGNTIRIAVICIVAIGLIIIFAVVCTYILQRCISWRPKSKRERNSNRNQSQPQQAASSNNSNPSNAGAPVAGAIYRPGKGPARRQAPAEEITGAPSQEVNPLLHGNQGGRTLPPTAPPVGDVGQGAGAFVLDDDGYLRDDRPMSLPPSYDEVMRQDSVGNQV